MCSFSACFCVKQKTAYELRIIDWSSDVCSSDLWSAGLRLHMEKQCAMWANRTASIEHNVDALGTANMKLYSPEERAALAIMMGNMEQLLGQVEDEPGPLIKAVLARLDTALRAYDLFIARSDSCPPA